MTGLLVALALKCECRLVTHSWFDLYLFVGGLLSYCLSIEANDLLFVAYSLHAAAVEFLQGAFESNANRWHRRQLWLIMTCKRRTKQATLIFHRIAIAEVDQIVEWVVLQKVIIKNLVTILLINVTSMAETSIWIFDAFFEDLGAVCVVDKFPLLCKK